MAVVLHPNARGDFSLSDLKEGDPALLVYGPQEMTCCPCTVAKVVADGDCVTAITVQKDKRYKHIHIADPRGIKHTFLRTDGNGAFHLKGCTRSDVFLYIGVQSSPAVHLMWI